MVITKITCILGLLVMLFEGRRLLKAIRKDKNFTMEFLLTFGGAFVFLSSIFEILSNS